MHTVHAHTDVSGLYLCVQLEAYSPPPPQYSPALLFSFFLCLFGNTRPANGDKEKASDYTDIHVNLLQ